MPLRSDARIGHAPILVNGSPLWPPVTGVQRVARGLVTRLLDEAEPSEVGILGPPEEFGGGSGGLRHRLVRVAWEQTVLPVAAARAKALLNLGNLAPLAGRRNLVLTYDLHALRHPTHYRAAWGRPYWAMAAAAYRRARHRITLTRTIADDLEATLGGHVDAVVPPGIDDTFRPASAERVEAVRARFRLEGPYLTVVGWRQPGKRASLAVSAHRLLVGDVPHQLVLAGAGRPDFGATGLDDLPPTVVITGGLSDDDLAALHTGSAGLVFCTEYEGFGLPPVEALACGSPVTSSRLPITEEVLGGLPGVTFIESGDPRAWALAAERLLASSGEIAEAEATRRSEAVLARYPWEGKGRTLLDLVRA